MILAHCKLQGQSGHDAGRKLLRQLYREQTGREIPEIAVTDRGKPYFPESPWHFSISHTKRHAFCALSRNPVGIDAEELDRDVKLTLADKILSPTEKAQFDATPDPHRALLTFWVLKEAAAKQSGKGLGKAAWNTDFSPDDPRIFVMDNCYLAIISNFIQCRCCSFN